MISGYRLDEAAFYANGKKYLFNLELGNVRPNQQNIPIHGFLTNVPDWQQVVPALELRH